MGGLSSKVSVAQRLAGYQSACGKGFAFASLPHPPQSFLHVLNYLYFGLRFFLFFLYLFSPLSRWRERGSEQVAVWVPNCWLGSTHHNIIKLFNIIWMCTVANFIPKYVSMAVYIKVKTVLMPKIHVKTSSC